MRKSAKYFSIILLMITWFYSCESTTLKVYVLDGGSLIFNNSLHWFSDAYKDFPRKTLANTVFLIEHPNGRLLWDAGLDDKFADRNPEEIDTTAKLVYFDQFCMNEVNQFSSCIEILKR